MIPINCNNNVFNEIILALDAYCQYQSLTTGKIVANPFVADPNGVAMIPYYDLEAIRKSPDKTIFIEMPTEGFHVSFNFYNYPRDKKYVFVSNGTWNQSKFDFGIEYKILHYSYFLYDYTKRATAHNLIDYFQDKDYIFSLDKPMTFCAFVGTANDRNWRTDLVRIIQDTVTFDNYILNFDGRELGQPSRELDIKINFDNFNPWIPIKQFYTISTSIPINIYNASRILLVSETMAYDHDEFHLTEKTIKALLTGIPFVVFGSYHYVKNLKTLGFKTYSDLWPEDYDDIADMHERMQAVADILNHINSMPWTQNELDKCQQIAYHNKAMLLNVNSIMKQELEEIIKIFGNYQL